jgi:hypothetical protein
LGNAFGQTSSTQNLFDASVSPQIADFLGARNWQNHKNPKKNKKCDGKLGRAGECKEGQGTTGKSRVRGKTSAAKIFPSKARPSPPRGQGEEFWISKQVFLFFLPRRIAGSGARIK